MLIVVTLLVVIFISVNNIAYTCDPDPYNETLVVAPGSYLEASSDQGTDWSPSDTKGQMTFNEGTCQYEKIVLGLPVNTNYEWKVAFNGTWSGNKGCNNDNNCGFNSGSSGAVRLIYNPYNDQLTTSPISSNLTTTTPGTSTSTVPSKCGDGKCVPTKTHKTCPQDCPTV